MTLGGLETQAIRRFNRRERLKWHTLARFVLSHRRRITSDPFQHSPAETFLAVITPMPAGSANRLGGTRVSERSPGPPFRSQLGEPNLVDSWFETKQ